MSKHRLAPSHLRTVLILSLFALGAWTVRVLAYSDGIDGVAQSAQGCSCHSSTPNASGAATVQITGPQSVAPNTTSNYTITVSGGPSGSAGGFDLVATGGTLIPGANSQIMSGDLTHLSPGRSWTFSWTSPAVAAPVSFYAVAQSTNGGGRSGDSWNWYGGAVNSPFTINVATLDVGDAAPGALALAPPFPSPFSAATRVDFVLPRPGAVRVEVIDPSGRRVATLVRGELPAGPHSVSWNGLTERGAAAPSGLYLVKLTADGRSLTRRVTRVH